MNFDIQHTLCYSKCVALDFQLFQCTFNLPIIDLLQNKDESLKWTASAFKCDY